MTGERTDGQRGSGDTAIRRLTAAAVLLVAAIAALVSFVHIQDLALRYGQSTLAAFLLPISIDGTVVVASLAMLRAARFGLGTPRFARFMLVLAVAATLAANVGYGAGYGIPGALISGWPAVAFIGCAELAIGMVRRVRAAGEHSREHQSEHVGESAAEQVSTVLTEHPSEHGGQVLTVLPTEHPEHVPTETTGDRAPVRAQTPLPRGERRGVSRRPHPPLTPTSTNRIDRRALVEQAVEQAGGDPDKVNARQVAREHGIGYSTVRRHLGDIRDEQAQEATADAH